MTTPPAPAVAILNPDEVLTGEAVALDVQPLGFLLRFVGGLIDFAVLFLTWVLVAVVLMTTVFQVSSGTFAIVLIVLLVFLMVFVPMAIETLTKGRSLGKLIVGGRIVRNDGGAAGLRQAAIRATVGVLEVWFTFGVLASLVGMFTPRAERLGDLVAGTYSQRTRIPVLPPVSPGVPPELIEWAHVADVSRLPDPLARRCVQFTQEMNAMVPAARARLGAELAEELLPYVSPRPAADPIRFVAAVVAVRRERESRALTNQLARVARLTAGATGAPPGTPDR